MSYHTQITSRPRTSWVCSFRTMELFHLLSGYIMPWWEMARLNPEKRFPLTFKRIDEMEDDEKAEMKREQVRFGIQAGYDEICKLYQR